MSDLWASQIQQELAYLVKGRGLPIPDAGFRGFADTEARLVAGGGEVSMQPGFVRLGNFLAGGSGTGNVFINAGRQRSAGDGTQTKPFQITRRAAVGQYGDCYAQIVGLSFLPDAAGGPESRHPQGRCVPAGKPQ